MKFNNFEKKILTVATALGIGHTAASQDINKQADQAFASGRATTSESASVVKKNTSEGLHVWTNASAKTEAGRITPTGKLNGFESTKLSEADLEKIADKFGFDKSSNLAFQTDLYNYLAVSRPDIMKKIINDLGPANAGLDEKGNLKPDALIGSRTQIAVEELNKTETPTLVSIPEVKKVVQPTGGFILEVRGDEKDSRGGYFFFDTKAEWEEVLNSLPLASKEVFDGDTKGQAMVNANLTVLLENYPGAATALEKKDVWARDGKDASLFTIKTEGKHSPSTTGDSSKTAVNIEIGDSYLAQNK